MSKKKYITPTIEVYSINGQTILETSQGAGYAIDGGNVIPVVEEEEEDSLFIIID